VLGVKFLHNRAHLSATGAV